jgi:hypothetical protein
MGGARGYGDDVVNGAKPHRHIAAEIAANAQLALSVAAPGPDRAIRSQRKGVRIPGSNRNDPSQADYLHWTGALSGGAVAELTGCVISPGPNRAVRSDRQTVVKSGRKLR